MRGFIVNGVVVCVVAFLGGCVNGGERIAMREGKEMLSAQASSKPDCAKMRIKGTVRRSDGAIIAEKNKTVIHVGEDDWRDYVAEFDLVLDPKAKGNCRILMSVLDKPHPWHYAEMQLTIKPDKTGEALALDTKVFNTKTNKYYTDLSTYTHKFAPTDKLRKKKMKDRKVKARSWFGKKLHVRLIQANDFFQIWFEHRFVAEYATPDRAYAGFEIALRKGDSVSNLRVSSYSQADSRFLPLPLDLYLNDTAKGEVASGDVSIDKIPFKLDAVNGKNNLFLKDAGWVEHKSDPSNYYGCYELGEWFAGDPSRPFFRLPVDDYSAVWLLAATDDDKRFSENVSFRIGKVTGTAHGMFRLQNYQVRIPRMNQSGGKNVVETVKTGAGNLFLIKVPLAAALSRDFEDFMTLDVNKELKLAVRQPDPCRFRIRPLGLPSGVRIFGMTLERSPLTLTLESPESGNVFNEPQKPYFTAKLANRTARKEDVAITAVATNPDGERKVFKTTATLLPNERTTLIITFGDLKRGFYDMTVSLTSSDGAEILRRSTTFALLAANTRDYSERGPWGTWNFNGAHCTSKDIDKYGPLMRKLGIRYTLAATDEKLAKYGLRCNAYPRTQAKGCAEKVKKWVAKYPHGVKRGLIFHEDAVSGAHVMRFPDCLLGRSPYKFNEQERKRFDAMWKNAMDACAEMRRELPDFKLQLGNGNPQLIEEFLRRKFPKKYLDAIGNENCGFMRPPEAQPDNVGFSTLWTFQEIMKHYGYDDIPLDICYEWMCRGTNPGNLTFAQQRDYYMRDALLGLAWGLTIINPGLITDVNNGYFFTNWGSTGFCHGAPEMNPKPSYVGFAVLTQVLDGATFKEALPTKSPSLYCLRFVNKKGRNIHALWTVIGKREVKLRFAGNTSFKITDWQGRETNEKTKDAAAGITLSSTPLFLDCPSAITGVEPGESIFASQPPAKKQLIDALDDLGRWRVEQGENLELETHNFDSPRRKGNFSFKVVADSENGGKCVRIDANKPKSGTPVQAMYEVMALKKPVVLKGKPRTIGLMVDGNSCWGRIIFELEDASGQRWISIGASQNGTPTRWMADWMTKKELEQVKNMSVADWNTNDSEARSAIDFDGWRYLSFPLPGQYDGEGYHWPRNCYWKSDKDGIVHYPLKFKKLIVELREKVVYIKKMVDPTRNYIRVKDLTTGDSE